MLYILICLEYNTVLLTVDYISRLVRHILYVIFILYYIYVSVCIYIKSYIT